MLVNEKGQITTDNINFQERNHTDFLKYEGPTDPKYTGSLGNVFSYKGFHLNVFLTYSFGNVVRLDPKFRAKYNDMSSMTQAFNNRWVQSGEEKKTDVPASSAAESMRRIPTCAMPTTATTTLRLASLRGTSSV